MSHLERVIASELYCQHLSIALFYSWHVHEPVSETIDIVADTLASWKWAEMLFLLFYHTLLLHNRPQV